MRSISGWPSTPTSSTSTSNQEAATGGRAMTRQTMKESSTVRAFVAIEPDAATRSALAEALLPLKQVDGLKLTPAENLHVTLKFIGDVESAAMGDVRAALEMAVEGVAPFSLEATDAIVLPNPRQPRVLAAAFDKPALLSLLHEQVERMLGEAGVEPEGRPYRPHLTLGRFKRKPRGPLPTVALPESLGFMVRSIGLIESRPTPTGAVYTPIARYGLTG